MKLWSIFLHQVSFHLLYVPIYLTLRLFLLVQIKSGIGLPYFERARSSVEDEYWMILFIFRLGYINLWLWFLFSFVDILYLFEDYVLSLLLIYLVLELLLLEGQTPDFLFIFESNGPLGDDVFQLKYLRTIYPH